MIYLEKVVIVIGLIQVVDDEGLKSRVVSDQGQKLSKVRPVSCHQAGNCVRKSLGDCPIIALLELLVGLMNVLPRVKVISNNFRCVAIVGVAFGCLG